MRRVVTNTGPVVHLREAGALELLWLTGEVHAATAVDMELGQFDASWRSGRPAWIRVVTLMDAAQQEALAWQQAGVLHAGEAETLALAQQLSADWVLTDDAAARLVARSLGREVHGSLGVILWVAAVGHLNDAEAEATLERLVGSSLWMSARVVAEARAALREIFEQAGRGKSGGHAMPDNTGSSALLLPADDGGSGEPAVVFLHSLGGRPAQWSAQLDHLRPGRRAIALTLRGHSGGPAAMSFSIPELAADVGRTADALGLHPYVLVGHSLGAFVAAACAAAAPERVAGLLLVDPGSDPRRFPAEQAEALRRGLTSDKYTETIEGLWSMELAGARPEVQKAVMADLRSTPRKTMIGGLSALGDFDVVTPLAAYPGPVLAVTTHLSEGPFALPTLVPKISATRLEGASHWLQMDRPDEFNRIMDRFIARITT